MTHPLQSLHARTTHCVTFLTSLLLICLATTSQAANTLPTFIPKAPQVEAKQSLLMDAQSGKILTSVSPDQKIEPASLTKMMTLYVIFHALKNQQFTLQTPVRIPIPAWKMQGSRMFLEPNHQVPVEILIEGIIVTSGNDACVSMAHFVAGSEASFADMMNQTANYLGMKNSHFTDSTGMPDPDHYSTARDLAILSRALIRDFPEYYHYFKMKKLTYNKITQTNRNTLLWRDPRVDGIKTGHTDAAGYCLASSALAAPTRLIAITLGSPSEASRARANESLLNWGFRFYESKTLYTAGETVLTERVWHGANPNVRLGVLENVYITLPKGRQQGMKVNIEKKQDELVAPVRKGVVYATAKVSVNDEVIASIPLVALEDSPKGSGWTRFKDGVSHSIQHWTQ